MVPGRDSFTLMKHEYPYSRNNNSFLSIIMWECSWHVCSKACMQTAEWPRRSDSVRLGKVDRETSECTATTLMRRRFMSCWSAERKPWLILGKTIWAGVWGQEVEGQRWEKVEEGWSPRRRRRRREEEIKCKKEQILLERLVFMNPGPASSQI